MAETTFQDYTYQSDIQNDLVSKNSQLRSFDDYTDGLGFESQFEGVPAGQIITGGLQIKKKTFADGSNGIWIGVDADGLAKINVGNSTSYMYWDGTTLGIAGSVVVGGSFTATTITGSTITGSTITGTTLTSATTGQRIVINSSNLSIYNSANALCGSISGSTSGGVNSVELTGSGVDSIVDINATGAGGVALQVDGATYIEADGAMGSLVVNRDIEPVVPSNLGSVTYPFVDFFLAGDMYSDGYINVGAFMNLARLSGAAAALLTPQNGSMYYRTDDDTIRVYRAGSWRTVTTS